MFVPCRSFARLASVSVYAQFADLVRQMPQLVQDSTTTLHSRAAIMAQCLAYWGPSSCIRRAWNTSAAQQGRYATRPDRSILQSEKYSASQACSAQSIYQRGMHTATYGRECADRLAQGLPAWARVGHTHRLHIERNAWPCRKRVALTLRHTELLTWRERRVQ